MHDPFTPAAGIWKRLLLGAVLIVVATAATTAAAGFNELNGFVDALNRSPAPDLGNELSPAGPGAPQTILLLGSDKRANGAIDSANPPHTDTMMLVRLDPAQSAIAVLSIPRDLQVTIDVPGRGPMTEKINAAYSIGGPKLALKVVKSTLGISVNHLVDTTFGGFKQAVDLLGCVYVDVDHHYFNDNSTGSQQYATINVPAGYQKLCGQDALDYVRYRHADSDFVRVTRQQDFLRQVKDQLGTQKILGRRQQLARIFGSATTTDIHSAGAVLRLLELLVTMAGHQLRQVHFQAVPGPSYVTATPGQIQSTLQDFLHPGPAAPVTAPHVSAPAGGRGAARGSSPELEQLPSLGLAAAQNLSGAGIPVYYPQLLRAGAVYAQDSRVYSLADEGGVVHRAYRLVAQMASPGDYYGIQGTDWLDPPILRHPSETRIVAGRRFELFFSGSHLRLVAWRAGGAVYWLSNSLLQALTNPQMLSIAASTLPAG